MANDYTSDRQPKYLGTLFPAMFVHLSDPLIDSFTACGIEFSANIKRTKNLGDVTCGNCVAIADSAREASK